ncbi:MAG: 2-dehydropantoate 2-reductase, partial [Verrucomicrobiota bacterium]
MKIGVVGCGALGSFYGAKLLQAGNEVWFLLRSDYETVRQNGVVIRSYQGDFHIHPLCARTPHEIGTCDWVLIGLKTTANAQFSSLVTPLVGPHTAIVTLQNGLGNEAQLAALFGTEKILGGLCFVCLNRTAPGVIHHIDHGRVELGEYGRPPQPRTHQLAGWFRSQGVPCDVVIDLERAHWEKLVWNIPFNGLGTASCAGLAAVLRGELSPRQPLGRCLTTEELLADTGWAALVRELMLEVIQTARALGYAVPEKLADEHLDRTRTMGAYK